MYLAIGSRVDIAHAVSQLSKFNNNYGMIHWVAAKRVLRYLKGTRDLGLLFNGDLNGLSLEGFADANFAGDIDNRRSTTGYLFLAFNGPISCKSKLQPTVAISTTEAEYMSLSMALQEGLWLKSLINEMDVTTANSPSVKIHSDNQGAISLTKNTGNHGRTKHIDVKHHFIRHHVNAGDINMHYCPTKEMLADILTKQLPRNQFENLRYKLGMRIVPMSGSCENYN